MRTVIDTLCAVNYGSHMVEVIRSDIFVEWLDDLRDRQARARIIKRIERVERDGHFGKVEPVGDGVFEFKFA